MCGKEAGVFCEIIQVTIVQNYPTAQHGETCQLEAKQGMNVPGWGSVVSLLPMLHTSTLQILSREAKSKIPRSANSAGPDPTKPNIVPLYRLVANVIAALSEY